MEGEHRTMVTDASLSGPKPLWWYFGLFPIWCAIARRGNKGMQLKMEKVEEDRENAHEHDGVDVIANDADYQPSGGGFCMAIFFICFGSFCFCDSARQSKLLLTSCEFCLNKLRNGLPLSFSSTDACCLGRFLPHRFLCLGVGVLRYHSYHDWFKRCFCRSWNTLYSRFGLLQIVRMFESKATPILILQLRDEKGRLE